MGPFARAHPRPEAIAPTPRLRSLATWLALVIGSATPMTCHLWPLQDDRERGGTLAAIAAWVVATFLFERLLLRKRMHEAACFVVRGATLQMAITWGLFLALQSDALVLVYMPAVLLLLPLSLLPHLFFPMGLPFAIGHFGSAFFEALLGGASHFLIAIVIASGAWAGSLPRTVVARRRTRPSSVDRGKGTPS